MKKFLFVLAVVLAGSCSYKSKKKTDSAAAFTPKQDTIVVAYAYNATYNLARALRTISKVPKITDSAAKTWDWAIDTSYIVEIPATPLDTLRDSLHNPRFDANHLPLLRKSFSTTIHTPLPSYFWPLIPR